MQVTGASAAVPITASRAASAPDPAPLPSVPGSAAAPALPIDAGLANAPAPLAMHVATLATQPYPPASSVPTQHGPDGIRFDFNGGARVLLPPRANGAWRVRLRDLDSGNILFESENQGAFVSSAKRWYVRFLLEVWAIEDGAAPRLVLAHEYNAAEREVLIQFPIGTLGDTLAWFPYAARFKAAHRQARVTCALSPLIIPLLRDSYPELMLVSHDEHAERGLAEGAYATYCLGLFFDDAACDWQPTDFRLVGLHRTAGYILGVDPTEVAPRLSPDDRGPPIPEPYAVIAVQSSSGCKYWTNPTGWRDVVASLRARGLRVVCIDQKAVHGHGLMWMHVPHGAEDETGDRPLTERARWLKHASVFIGLSSGLAWLAWAAGCPVVLISGFTHPNNEFASPYRVHNWHACNSCWNDPTLRFDHHDFLWCPRHQNTPRHFECSRLITAAHVLATIDRVPGLPASAAVAG